MVIFTLMNLITYDYGSGNNEQCRIIDSLQSGRKYILVVATRTKPIGGSLLITAVGQDSVYFTP
jgi:hypothetical protein